MSLGVTIRSFQYFIYSHLFLNLQSMLHIYTTFSTHRVPINRTTMLCVKQRWWYPWNGSLTTYSTVKRWFASLWMKRVNMKKELPINKPFPVLCAVTCFDLESCLYHWQPKMCENTVLVRTILKSCQRSTECTEAIFFLQDLLLSWSYLPPPENMENFCL